MGFNSGFKGLRYTVKGNMDGVTAIQRSEKTKEPGQGKFRGNR